MAHHLKSCDYGSLTGQERFVLLVDAMSRRDQREANRLEDTCPTRVYRCEDAAFRDRTRLAYTIALRVCLEMRSGLAQIRLAKLLRENAATFSTGVASLAQVAFLFGREYGKWESGVIEAVPLPDEKALAEEIAGNPDLASQIEELRELALEGTRAAATTVEQGIGQLHATNLLSQWEGFGRFCREALEIEPLVLLRAFGLADGDPGEEVRAVCPDASIDEAVAIQWTGSWRHSWERWFR